MELELKKLTKEFQGFKAVDDITLTMSNGVYGLLGVNGAGKTTLMRMLCTLIKPTSGSILCDGKDIFALDGEYRRILGYLPQEFGFYPEFSVHDYLMYIASIKGMRTSIARKRVTELLRQVGLAKMQNRKMKKLSGGMKRRAGIAQAMLNNPKILILDEPTNHLDMKTKDILKQALMDFDGTLIVVSHDRDFLDGLVTKVYEFGNKKVTEHLEGIYEFLQRKKMENLNELERKN